MVGCWVVCLVGWLFCLMCCAFVQFEFLVCLAVRVFYFVCVFVCLFVCVFVCHVCAYMCLFDCVCGWLFVCLFVC